MATKLERLEFAIGMRDEASKKVGALRKSISGMANTVHSQMLKIGTGWLGAKGLSSSIGEMVAPARDLNRALGEVSSLGVDGASLKLLEASAKGFAMQYGGTAAEVVRASYDIQSAISGLSGEELASFTVAGGILARATKADVATVTDYMGTMYGVFQKQADKMGRAEWVEKITGQTARAVQMFKTNGAKWAQGVSTLGSSATAAGIAMEEQFAVLGNLQLTMGGSEAATKYNAFLTGALGAQKKLGLSFFDKDGTMNSIVDIFSKLRKKFGDSLDSGEKLKLKEAFGSDEALKFIDQLMGKTGQLAADMAAIGSVKGLGPAQAMAAKMTDIWQRLGGAVNVVAASFGQKLLPPLAMVGGKILDVLKTLNRWIAIAPNVARWVGYGAIAAMSLAAAMGVLAAATAVGKLALLGLGGPLRIVGAAIGFLTKITGLQTAAQWLLNSAFLANPMTWVVLGITSLIAIVGDMLGCWDGLKASLGDTWWGNAIVEAVLAIIAPFRALLKLGSGIMEMFGVGGGGGKNAAVLAAGAAAASPVAAPPAPPASTPMLDAPRTTAVPAGGLMRTYANTVNRNSAKQTTIGQVHINSQTPMTPAELDEWAALGAG